MNKKGITFLILLIIVVTGLLILGFFYFYQSKITGTNYLIAGVPYNGFYNLFLRTYSLGIAGEPTAVPSIKDILDYWGDER